MMTPTRTSILSVLLTGAASLSAQTAPAPVHHATTTATTPHRATVAASGGCVTDTPPLSPKIPALPAGTPCIKALLTFTQTPSVKLDYVSPLVTPEVREALGLASVTFSLNYSEVKAGTGALGLPHKFYTVNYTGYLTDGTKFDSSIGEGKKPFSFPIGAHRVISGWDLGLQGMHIGGKRRLYIPWQLAYGDKGNQGIPPRAELVFDIELISQSDTDPSAPPAPPTPPTPPTTPKPSTPPAQPGAPAATLPAPKPATTPQQ